MGPNFREILPVLAAKGTRFIVIGGGAASRPKDWESIAELEAILEERARR